MEKIDITATGVVDSIRNKMAVATVSNKGLMPSGVLSEFQGAYSVLLFETTSTPVTGSILLSISATSSGMPRPAILTNGRSRTNVLYVNIYQRDDRVSF